MRSKVIVAAIFSMGFAGISNAADINQQGADNLRDILISPLSRDLAKSDFVTVKPAGDQYEITYDLAKFFDKINSSVLSVTGFKPLSLFAKPVEQGE